MSGYSWGLRVTDPIAIPCRYVRRDELAVRAGGDTDTTAAVTGALAGTVYGTEGTLPYCGVLEDARTMAVMDGDLFLRGGR